MKKAVVAVIPHPEGERLILGVSRRDDHTAMGLPGGKVEPGEKEDDAIVREVEEETGMLFEDPVVVYADTRPTGVNVYAYIGKASGKHRSSEEGLTRWCTPEELIAGPFGEYNQKLFDKLGIEYSGNS